MKKFIVFLIVLTIMPTMMMADGYSKLWKQVEQAAEDELPQDEIKFLQEIVKKAKKQHSYGNLLKAELLLNEVMLEISPDSAAVAFRAIETETAAMEGQDPVMAAVYNCVLGKMYREGYSAVNPEASYSEGYDKAKECYRKAMSNPALLARHKAGELKPALVEGYHSYIYNHDLLSVIGYETKDFETLHNWYERGHEGRQHDDGLATDEKQEPLRTELREKPIPPATGLAHREIRRPEGVRRGGLRTL